MDRDPTQAPSRIKLTEQRHYPFWRLVRANIYDFVRLLRESQTALIGFVLLLLAGTIYLITTTTLRPTEALYETLKLLSLQSGLDMPHDPLGIFLFFLIPLLGLALIFQSVLNFGRLLLDKDSRREAWQLALAATFRDHVIVCGLGRVSMRVVTQLLAAGYEVVVIEREWTSEFVERTRRLKVPVVLGDGREPQTLQQAGLLRARALVVGIDDDLLNIEIGLTAREVRPDLRVVLRVFDYTLGRNLGVTFGKNSTFSTSFLAAPTFAAAAVSRDVDYVLSFNDQLLGVARLVVQQDSHIATFVRAVEEQHHVRVLYHQTDTGTRVVPGMMSKLNGGDTVLLIGTLAALEAVRVNNLLHSKVAFISALPLQRPNATFNTVIVCGLGRVSYRTIRQLYRLRPRPQIVVVHAEDEHPEDARALAQVPGIVLQVGDARDVAVLRKAGLDQAYSVVALSSDDLRNLQIGLAARRHRDDVHLVLRVFSDALAEKLARPLKIRTTYSTSGLAGPTLAAAAVLGDVTNGFFADDLLFSTDDVEVRAGDRLDGQSIDQLRRAHQVLGIRLRNGEAVTLLPGLEQRLAAGDTVTLLAPLTALERLRTLLGSEPPPHRAPHKPRSDGVQRLGA